MVSCSKKVFIDRAKIKHGDLYDYSLVEYINSSTKVKVKCPIHGVFEVRPYSHAPVKKGKKGAGCRKCAGFGRTTEDFIRDAKEIHGDKYDYSDSKYVKARDKIIVNCPIHGPWKTTHYSHIINKHGCQSCGAMLRAPDLEDLISKFRTVHKDKYDYSLVEWGAKKKGEHGWWIPIRIICKKHGEFKMTPATHFYQKSNCPKCMNEQNSERQQKTQKEFLKQAKSIHGKTYLYSRTKYRGDQKNIWIKCRVHGYFEQRADHHLNGSGCSRCINKSEGRIAEILEQKHIVHRRYFIDKYEFDFFLPELNLIIERDGEQHYMTVNFFKNKKANTIEGQQEIDTAKTELVKKNGHDIARIPFWLSDEEVSKEIENILTGRPSYPDIPDLKQLETQPKPKSSN